MEKMSIPIGAKLPSRTKRIEPQQDFLQRIAHECRRAERSKLRFLLVLIEGVADRMPAVPAFAAPISNITRDTDSMGWYCADSTLGILFTELGGSTAESSLETILTKVKQAILQSGEAEGHAVSAYILPRDLNGQIVLEDKAERVYACLEPFSSPSRRLQLRIKRIIDLVVSFLLLLALSPLMAAIAIAVKLSSPGPVLFRQTRVGQGGRHFPFLKFRSMLVSSDPSLHENYVKQFIRGTAP